MLLLRHTRLLMLALLALTALTGCNQSQKPSPQSQVPDGLREVNRTDWAEYFSQRGYNPDSCTFVLWEPDSQRYSLFNPLLARQGTLPASTFKIPNTLIGLATGAIPDSSTVFKYDGSERSRTDILHNMALPEAFRRSAVWYYQQVARKVGLAQYKSWLDTLHYGNGNFSAGVDMFWLEGGFRITPIEQVQFLERVFTGQTPFKPEHIAVLSAISLEDTLGGAPYHGKTGWATNARHAERGDRHIGWWVGWVDLPAGRKAYFALRIFHPSPLPETWTLDRKGIARDILIKQGILKR